MSICIYKNKCNPAASARNVEYITRDSACESISFHNLDELRDDDRTLAKSNAINFAEQREIEEEARIIGNERGTPRNHNRMIISFDRKEETEIAKEEVHKFLDENFSNQRAVVSIHQDGKATHCHIWFDIRDIETDRKTQIPAKDFYSLDEKWARQYDERYKTDYEREYTTKKRETFEWKKAEYERTQGVEGKKELPENKPERHIDNKTQILRDKEIRDYGIEKSADRENQRLVTAGRSGINEGKQTIAQAERAVDNSQQRADISKLEHERGHKELEATDRNFESTIRAAERAAERIEQQRAEQSRQRSRDDDGYSR